MDDVRGAMPAIFIGACALGYLLGSIPFGLVITRLAGLGDIRTIGSGNIGATNVLRTGRRDLAAATLVLDAGKAGLAYLLGAAGAAALNQSPEQSQTVGLIAGGAAFIGHCFPIWLKFKGGKGVATFLGLLLASMWQVGLAFCLVWLAVAGLFRISSLAALLATAATPIVAFWLCPDSAGWIVACVLGVLIYWRHRANISRIVAGTEPKIGARKEAAAASAAGEPGARDGPTTP